MEKEKYISDRYFTIIIILAIIIFIGGIALGNMYPSITLKDYYKSTSLQLQDYMYDSTFNVPLMLTVWGSDFIFTLFMLLLCDILKTQEQIKYELNK